MKILKYTILLLVLMLTVSVADAQSFIAYDLTTSTAGASYNGNQNYLAEQGMQFDVNAASITITQLGAFDANRDGFHNVITTYVYNRDTHALLASQTFSGTSGPSEGTLMGYHRFRDINALTLSAGHYLIAAGGFGTLDQLGNKNYSGFVADTFNNGGGAISTAGSVYYAPDTPGIYPNSVASTTDGLFFNNASFIYSLAVPEPSSMGLLSALLSVGIIGTFAARSRRRRPARSTR